MQLDWKEELAGVQAILASKAELLSFPYLYPPRKSLGSLPKSTPPAQTPGIRHP